ncbi:MAG: GntR family transcriptional regulator [Defluviimonas sp.]|nr:GntR family transcriptional regulator [Defluviimonas sp.]
MEPVELAALVRPDRGLGGPLAIQIYRGLLDAIRAGELAGSLPSSRAAAAALAVSRNTVLSAYKLLRAEGAVTIRAMVAPARPSLGPA